MADLMPKRIGVDEYFLRMAMLASQRATCSRRKVGCILVDGFNHVLSSGYNGVARGVPHCIDKSCSGASLPSGTGLDKCEAVHAEANALLQCHNVNDITTVYCTASPCIQCTRLLLNTGAKRVVFAEEYPHPEARELWESVRGSSYDEVGHHQMLLRIPTWVHLKLLD